MSIYGYARVSTKEQHEDRQVQALLEYGVNEENIFVDKVSRKRFWKTRIQVYKRTIKENKRKWECTSNKIDR